MSECLICERVNLAVAKKNPFLIHEFKNSYFVLGDHHYFKGYSLLLLKDHVRELHELKPHVQQELFQEVMIAGKAVFDAFCPRKMNYSCYGNAEPHVHWHIFPRYEDEADHKRNPWLHSGDFKNQLNSDKEISEMVEKVRAKLHG